MTLENVFIGRERELKELDDAYESAKSEFVPIYGRRRVGKSELILQSLKKRGGIYFVGKQSPSSQQMREFLETSAVATGSDLLASSTFPTWAAALRAVVKEWRERKQNRKLILAIDEYQWLSESASDIASTLQELWDTEWQHSKDLVLILCGSFIGFMEREVLGKKSPLFGRRTRQIQLQPFTYRDAAKFQPNYSIVDRAKAYFICGGVPLYLRCFSDRYSIATNIIRTLLDEFSPLRREPDFLLREELRDVQSYYAVIAALAEGASTASDVARLSSVPERSLHYYFQQLLELGYIRKRSPLTCRKASRRSVRYEIDDPLLRFHFRFVYLHQSLLAQAGPEKAYQTIVAPQLDSYFGACFERLCREALPALYAKERVVTDFEIGEYWDSKTQIDVVGARQDGIIDLGECKWGALSLSQVTRELQAKAERYPNPKNRTIKLRLFCQKRPKQPDFPEIHVHDLGEMYS